MAMTLNRTVHSRLSNLQSGYAEVLLLPDCPTRSHLERAYKRAINKLLWELPPEERLFLADGGPEFMP